jgi:short-subunit dehydrogenase
MRDAVDQTVARFGHLDVLIANAGIGQRGSVVDSPWDDINIVIRTNVDGVLHSVRAAVPAMRTIGGGHIVIVSSVVAEMLTPYAAAYSASKAFVSSIARAMRYELEADGIGVTDVRVGRTDTEFNRRRLGAKGYADRAPRIPMMTVAFVAEGIVRAVERKQKTVVLRLFDRLILWANRLVPDLVARRALKQYKINDKN